jgi:hypothetical protein
MKKFCHESTWTSRPSLENARCFLHFETESLVIKHLLMEIRGDCDSHSAGSLVALQAYLDAPEKVAAMILIAPAITAPLIMEEVKKATTGPNPGTHVILMLAINLLESITYPFLRRLNDSVRILRGLGFYNGILHGRNVQSGSRHHFQFHLL